MQQFAACFIPDRLRRRGGCRRRRVRSRIVGVSLELLGEPSLAVIRRQRQLFGQPSWEVGVGDEGTTERYGVARSNVQL